MLHQLADFDGSLLEIVDSKPGKSFWLQQRPDVSGSNMFVDHKLEPKHAIAKKQKY